MQKRLFLKSAVRLIPALASVFIANSAGLADPANTEITDQVAKSSEITLPKAINVPVLPGNSAVPRRGRPRIAIALGGGGVRGAAHVGVLRVLSQAGIPIDIIAGTSMGAIVGGMYSAGVSIDSIAKKFDDGTLMRSYMNVPLKLSIAAAPVVAVPKTFAHKEYEGLYSGATFLKYLDQTVPSCGQKIENLRIRFAAVALDLTDGKPYALTSGSLDSAIQASSAVPELREPVQIGNQLFVDGGVVDNIPVTVARDLGGDVVIAVDVDERFDKAPLESFKSIGSVAKRMVSYQLASSDAIHLQLADIVIHPNVDGIGLLTTKPKDARRAMEAGEQAAAVMLPLIRAKLEAANIALYRSNSFYH